jgi:hypothetical protein
MNLRKFLIGVYLTLLIFLFPKPVFAEENFATDVIVEYRFDESGTTTVIHNVTLENLLSNIYATSYKLILENIEPQNAKAYENGKELKMTKMKDGFSTTLLIEFTDSVVGKGKARNFSISFEDRSFAVRTGEVWEISIPRLSKESSFRNYNVRLLVPLAFGNEAYMSPGPLSLTKGDNFLIYDFSREIVSKTGITAGFGSFQVFNFTLNYHLENPLNKKAYTEIALPPDTDLQKIYYQEIAPEPASIYVDADGNWIAQYNLEARQRIDVQAKGSVQIFATIRPFPKPTQASLDDNLKETNYWQVSDPKIQALAARLKTPKEIYDFVWQNLSYDYGRVRPNVERLGAIQALSSPNTAICMEFTDLFVAIARAAGIPAREVNGYAYTENPKIQPLSLVADVLHSWPEYWNSETNSWTPVDPTWASTTGGVDFFSKLDLRHFTFVVHGQDALKPYAPGSYKLGSNPQKDVFVSFGQLLSDRTSEPDIEAEIKKGLPFTPEVINITVKNLGPAAFYNVDVRVLFDGQTVKTENIEVLPPLATFTTKVSVPFTLLGSKTPDLVTVAVENKKIEVPTSKSQMVLYNLLGLFIIISVLTFVVLIKLGKIRFQSIISKLKTRIGNVTKHIFKNPKDRANQ